ncbi:MAG: TetR/AcrR family transcriptional regulator [Solirubrobacterales bacterium]
MNKKAEYKNAVRSRRMIRQAFIELMQDKDIEKITVTEIIKRADLNRGTFYSHYQDTRAVIEEIENEIISKMLEFLGEVRYGHFFQNPLPLLLEVASYLENDLEFYRILINSKGSEQFFEKLKKIFVSHITTDSDIPDSIKTTSEFIIQAHFFAGGITNLYQKWFKGELDYSFNELSLNISKIIKSCSDNLL